MTPAEMKARKAANEEEQARLRREASALTLAIERAEGRPNSHAARFARAHLAGDLETMTRLCAENDAATFRETGKWTTHQALAEQLLAEAKP